MFHLNLTLSILASEFDLLSLSDIKNIYNISDRNSMAFYIQNQMKQILLYAWMKSNCTWDLKKRPL